MDRVGLRLAAAAALTCALALAFAGSAAALGHRVVIGANLTSLPSRAAVAVDGGGTAYIAWDDPLATATQPASTALDFCRLAVGTTGCTPQALRVSDPSHEQLSGPPSVLINGTDVYVFEYVDGGPSNDDGINEWVSFDGGATFTRVAHAISFSFVGDISGTGPMPVIRLLNGNVGIGYVSAVDNPLFEANSLAAPLNYSKGSAPPAPFATLNPSPDSYTIGDLGGEFASQLSGTPGVLGVFGLLATGPCATGNGLVFAYAPLSSTTTNAQLQTSTGLSGSPWRPIGKVTCNADNPALTSGPAGLGLLDTNEASNITQYRAFTARESFRAPVTVASESAHQPTVSQDGAGDLYATWLRNGAGLRLAYSADKGAAWAGPRTIVSERGSVGVDSIASAVGSGGRGWAVYASKGKEYAVSFGPADSYIRPNITHLGFRPRSPISTKHGAKVTYIDSQPAATTFKVIGHEPGYRLGRSHCKLLNPFGIRQQHSKPCTFDRLIGTIAHSDLTGANALQFSGRIKGHRLARGSYELRATPKLGPLKGRTVSVSFRTS